MRFHEARDKIGAQGRPTTSSETPERLPTTDFACKSEFRESIQKKNKKIIFSLAR